MMEPRLARLELLDVPQPCLQTFGTVTELDSLSLRTDTCIVTMHCTIAKVVATTLVLCFLSVFQKPFNTEKLARAWGRNVLKPNYDRPYI